MAHIIKNRSVTGGKFQKWQESENLTLQTSQLLHIQGINIQMKPLFLVRKKVN